MSFAKCSNCDSIHANHTQDECLEAMLKSMVIDFLDEKLPKASSAIRANALQQLANGYAGKGE